MRRSFITISAVVLLLASAANAQKAAVVFCALDDTLDFKTAKAGDSLALHTTYDLMDNDKVLLPRGTAITAKVIDAADAKSVSIALDHATLKSGAVVPLMGIIAAVSVHANKSLADDPLYSMNHLNTPTRSNDPNVGVASSGAEVQTAILKGESDPKSGLSLKSQGAIGIDGLDLKWVLDKPPATTVFTSKKKNLRIPKGSDMLLRMAPPAI